MTNKTKRIAELNDQCRKAMGAGRLAQTKGIVALPLRVQSAIRKKVETFNDFRPEIDTFGIRECGVFTHAGHHIFWEIDCFTRKPFRNSPDRSNPRKTVRVLTIMLASEF